MSSDEEAPPLPAPDERHEQMTTLWKQIERSPLASDEAGGDAAATRDVTKEYYPLLDTLRLYAGWLLAWYFLIFALGSAQWLHHTPFQISFLSDLFLSPMILSFACACFLFLLLSSIHILLGRRLMVGIVLTLIGFGLFAVFYANM